MLARRLTTILPAMSLADALETTRLHRVAGLTGARTAVVTARLCCALHHIISEVGLIGGPGAPGQEGMTSGPLDADIMRGPSARICPMGLSLVAEGGVRPYTLRGRGMVTASTPLPCAVLWRI
jgi:hypothetical protein